MPINYQMLHELYSLRPIARALFDMVLEVGAEEGHTTVDEVTKGDSTKRRQAITLLRELEEAGCGEFKVGRKGHPSRLIWTGDPREIAGHVVGSVAAELEASEPPSRSDPESPAPAPTQASSTTSAGLELPLDLTLDLPELPATADESQPAPARERADSSRSAKRARATDEQIEHNYVLRVDYRVSVTLPADLTRREAEALGDWIRNLSFER